MPTVAWITCSHDHSAPRGRSRPARGSSHGRWGRWLSHLLAQTCRCRPAGAAGGRGSCCLPLWTVKGSVSRHWAPAMSMHSAQNRAARFRSARVRNPSVAARADARWEEQEAGRPQWESQLTTAVLRQQVRELASWALLQFHKLGTAVRVAGVVCGGPVSGRTRGGSRPGTLTSSASQTSCKSAIRPIKLRATGLLRAATLGR